MNLNFMKSLLTFCLFFFSTVLVFTQTNYFDRYGKVVADPSSSYYSREKTANGYTWMYTNGGAIYLEATAIEVSDEDENLNRYSGEVKFFFKNGAIKMSGHYNDRGAKDGSFVHYNENGNLKKEESYKNDRLENGEYTEYDEQGNANVVLTESFDDNFRDWELYTSSESSASLSGGVFTLNSISNNGTTRTIEVPDLSTSYSFEIKVDISKLKPGAKAGVVFGFKDWDNYQFFIVSKDRVSIGLVYEGISSIKVNDRITSYVKPTGWNTLKILAQEEKIFYSINGNVQLSTQQILPEGRGFGMVATKMSGPVVFDDFIYKRFGVSSKSNSTPDKAEANIKSTGSGILFTTDGFILTNHHVIEKANSIVVDLTKEGVTKSYTAKIVVSDKDNDLALLQIDDPEFVKPTAIPFTFRQVGGIDVGTELFTMGFPLALSGMGREAKFTDGKVSAKTGYNGATNSFQTTIPVQPGNSGGPIFNRQGELVGLVNATVENSDNVSYGIKSPFIFSLLDLAPVSPVVPSNNTIGTKSLPDQIKVISEFVTFIKVK